MRLVETRLLEGPNVYRLEPVVKLEFAVGRRRTFYGQRDPARSQRVCNVVRLRGDLPPGPGITSLGGARCLGVGACNTVTK